MGVRRTANDAEGALGSQRAGRRVDRIAYLLADHGIPFYQSGTGGPVHARSMVRAFAQEGRQVDVYVLNAGEPPLPGFDVTQIRAGWPVRAWIRGRKLLPWKRGRKWMRAVGLFLQQRDFGRQVSKHCRHRPPDILYARHSWLAHAYARQRGELGVPLVLEVNAVMSVEKAQRGQLRLPHLTRGIGKEGFETADVILPVTAELKSEIEALGVDPEKNRLTPNAVDLDLFCPQEPEGGAPRSGLRFGAVGPESPPFTVGFVHSFKAYHGMGLLLRAVERLRKEIPGLRLRVVGSGPEFEAASSHVRGMGLDDVAELTGTVAHDRVPALLYDCDVAVAPYHGPNNLYGCPMKLDEYMALRVPIVSADWGAIGDTLTHAETALLHEPGDVAGLVDGLLEVWRGAEIRRRAPRACWLAIACLMALTVMAGFLVQFAIAKYGIGVSPDSVRYLESAAYVREHGLDSLLPESLLADVTRVLRPGGAFVGSVSCLEPYHSFSYWNFTPYGWYVWLARRGTGGVLVGRVRQRESRKRPGVRGTRWCGLGGTPPGSVVRRRDLSRPLGSRVRR